MDYAQALEEALKAAGSQQAQQEMAANIEAGNSTYGQIKSQAAVSRSLEQQRLAQKMAEIGISAPPSLTVQTGSAMAGNREIGDVSRQNQNYTDTQNAMISQTDANAAAQAAGITAAMNEAENASNMEDTMNKFDRDYRLYMAKKMTASQFEKKTGINVKGWKKPSPPPNPDNDGGPQPKDPVINGVYDYLNYEVNQGRMTPDQAAAEWKRYSGGTKQPQGSGSGTPDTGAAGLGTSAASQPAKKITGFDVDQYIKQKETGAKYPEYYYRGKAKLWLDNPDYFTSKYGKPEYERYLDYYTTKAVMEENGLDQNLLAPNYGYLDDLIENRDIYIKQYGKLGYDRMWSTYKDKAAGDTVNIGSAVKLKETGYSADLWYASTWLNKNYQYTDSDEDKWRQSMGLVPKALQDSAKDIIAYANSIKKGKAADGQGTEGGTSSYSWDDVAAGNRLPTEAELFEAVDVINKETGDTSVGVYDENMVYVDAARKNPDLLGPPGDDYKVLIPNGATKEQIAAAIKTGVYIPENPTPKQAADIAEHVKTQIKNNEAMNQRAEEVAAAPSSDAASDMYYIAYDKRPPAEEFNKKVNDLGLGSTGLIDTSKLMGADKAFADMYNLQLDAVAGNLSGREKAGYRGKISGYITSNIGAQDKIKSYIDIYEDVYGKKPANDDLTALCDRLTGKVKFVSTGYDDPDALGGFGGGGGGGGGSFELEGKDKEFFDKAIRVAVSSDITLYTLQSKTINEALAKTKPIDIEVRERPDFKEVLAAPPPLEQNDAFGWMGIESGIKTEWNYIFEPTPEQFYSTVKTAFNALHGMSMESPEAQNLMDKGLADGTVTQQQYDQWEQSVQSSRDQTAQTQAKWQGYQFLTQDMADTITYLYSEYKKTGDNTKLMEYYNAIRPLMRDAQYTAFKGGMQDWVNEPGPTGEIVTGFMSGGDYLLSMGAYPYNAWNAANNLPSDPTAGIFQITRSAQDLPDIAVSTIKNPLAKWAVKTVITMAPQLAMDAINPVLGRFTSAAAAASRDVTEQIRAGATPYEAHVHATVMAAINYYTSKLMQKGFNAAMQGNMFNLPKGFLGNLQKYSLNALKTFGAGAYVTAQKTAFENIADMIIAGGRSRFSALVDQHLREGMTLPEAQGAAAVESFIKQPFESGIEGGLTAAASSVKGTYKNNASLKANQALQVSGVGGTGSDPYAKTGFGPPDEAALRETGMGRRLLPEVPGAAQPQLVKGMQGLLKPEGSSVPGKPGLLGLLGIPGLPGLPGLPIAPGVPGTAGAASAEGLLDNIDSKGEMGDNYKELPKSPSEYYTYASDIAKRTDFNIEEKVKTLQEAYYALGDGNRADIRCPANAKFLKDIGFDEDGIPIYDWPDYLGFDPDTIKPITRLQPLSDRTDRVGSLRGNSLSDVPQGREPYSNEERSLPDITNTEAYHVGNFKNGEYYFEVIDAIRNNDLNRLNAILKEKGIESLDSNLFTKIAGRYRQFLKTVYKDIGNIDATYGIQGIAAKWINRLTGEVYLPGGATQYTTPISIEALKRLGIFTE